MKKLITSLLAACMCLGIFCNTGSLSIRAEEISTHENPVIETREADWPDYNYGGWKDIAANPKKYEKAYKCTVTVLGASALAALAASGGAATFASIVKLFGLPAAWNWTTCMWF